MQQPNLAPMTPMQTLTLCRECERCSESCCRCATSNQLMLLSCKVYTGFLENVRTSRANPVDRTIGVEFEIAGFTNAKTRELTHLYNTCQKWHAAIGTDMSIKILPNKVQTNRQTVEIRTSPCGGTRYALQIRELLTAINNAGGVVNQTCGMHVHVGLQDVLNTLGEYNKARIVNIGLQEYVQDAQTVHSVNANLARIFGMWEVCEPAFYKCVADGRDLGVYAKRWAHVLATRPPVDINAPYLSGVLERAQAYGRYLGLNAAAVSKYGTVEYRLHHGCVDIETVMPWSLLCSHFVSTALMMENLGDAMRWVGEVTPERFLYEIAPTDEVRKYLVRVLGETAQPIKVPAYHLTRSTSKRSVKKRERKARYRRAA